MTKILTTLLSVGAAAVSTGANAAAILTLSFIEPTGTVASNAPIDVYLRLTADPASDSLTTDASGIPTSGYDFGSYAGPIDLNDPNTSVNLNVFFQGGGTFGGFDPTDPYQFSFNYNPPNLIAPANFNLNPGESLDYLFGTFTPTGGNAPAGTYQYFNTGVIVQFYNPGDVNDPDDDQFDSVTLVQTCASQDRSCAFERTVFSVSGAVPEPATWALMIGGFGGIGGTMRYRRRNTAVSFA